MNTDLLYCKDFLLLKICNQLLFNMMDAVPNVQFFVKNTHSQFIAVNQLLHHNCIHDIGHTSMLGRTDSDFYPLSIAEKFLEGDRLVFSSAQPLLRQVELIPHPDFSIHWYQTNKYPLFNSKQKVVGLAGMTYQISTSDQPLTDYKELNKALDYIRAHYTEHIKIEEIAEHSGISIRTLNRYFLKHLKTTPLGFLKKVRLLAASNLLSKTHKTVGEITYETGFSDQSHLTREFQKANQMSPIEYRKKHHVRSW